MTWKLIFIRGNELKMLVQLVVCAACDKSGGTQKSKQGIADKRIEFNFMSQKIILIARAGWAGASLAHRRSLGGASEASERARARTYTSAEQSRVRDVINQRVRRGVHQKHDKRWSVARKRADKPRAHSTPCSTRRSPPPVRPPLSFD